MSAILCIDFGLRRCGIATSDSDRIIASPVATISTQQIEAWLEVELPKRKISEILLGYPTRLDGSDTHITENVRLFKLRLASLFPHLKLTLIDERFSSKMASAALHQMGHKKKKHEKGLVDQVAAALILQEYLSLS